MTASHSLKKICWGDAQHVLHESQLNPKVHLDKLAVAYPPAEA